MKRFFRLVVILAVVGAAQGSWAGPEPAVRDVRQSDIDAVMSQRHELINQYMGRLTPPNASTDPDPQFDLAIKGLGELRAIEAAGMLSQHLMYLPEKITPDDKCTTEMYYPAAVALARIGEPAVQFLVDNIRHGYGDERKLAAWVVMTIESKAQAIHRLDDLIARDGDSHGRIAAARQYLATYKLTFDVPTRQPAPPAERSGAVLPMRDNGVLLQEIAPAEYEAYKKSLEGGYGVNSVNAALALIARVEQTIVRATGAGAEFRSVRAEAQIGLIYALTDLLEIYHKTSDAKAKAAVLEAWNKAVDRRSDLVELLHALDNEWDRVFFTDSLRKLFKETNDAELIRPFCRVLGDHGEDSEEALLKEKRPALKALDSDYTVYRVCLWNVDNALKKIGYWRAGDKDRVGGAAADGPRDEWPF